MSAFIATFVRNTLKCAYKFCRIFYFRKILKSFRSNTKREISEKVKKRRLQWRLENPGVPDENIKADAYEWALKLGVQCGYSKKYTKHFKFD